MNTRSIIGNLLASQTLAVLASYGEDQPYTSLVAFAAAQDLKAIYFATARATRKFDNLTSHPSVSMLIDNRANLPSDFRGGLAVTAIGVAGEADKAKEARLFLQRHPDLRDFLEAPDTALFEVRIGLYRLVTGLKHVLELDMSSQD